MENGTISSVFILLGTNLGDRFKNLLVAQQQIRITIAEITVQSSVYETAAWGNEDQPDFLNQVVHLHTSLQPQEILDRLLEIERKMGRKREAKWGPRIIDLDILLIGQRIIDTPQLKVPHPALHQRKFTLLPLSEIAADTMHPVFKTTIKNLLDECDDHLPVTRLNL